MEERIRLLEQDYINAFESNPVAKNTWFLIPEDIRDLIIKDFNCKPFDKRNGNSFRIADASNDKGYVFLTNIKNDMLEIHMLPTPTSNSYHMSWYKVDAIRNLLKDHNSLDISIYSKADGSNNCIKIKSIDWNTLRKILPKLINWSKQNQENIDEIYFRNKQSMNSKKRIWLVGSTFGGTDNKIDDFLESNIWEGHFDNRDDVAQIQLADLMTDNDIIVIKSTFTTGPGHKIPCLRIKAVGRICSLSREEYQQDGKLKTSFLANIEYISKVTKDFIGNEYGKYRKTIHELDNQDILYYIENLIGGNKMSDTEKYKSLLTAAHNLILHGAPGTGKTYIAKKIAEEMNAEVEFVQFHPSYDYTDFVEGLRPVKTDGGSQIGFERKNGVFKTFCEKALLSTSEGVVDNFNEVIETFVTKFDENDNQGIDIPLISGKGTFRIALNSNGDGFVTLIKQSDGAYEKDTGRFYNFEQCYRVYKNLPGVPKGGLDNYRKAIVTFLKKNYGLKEYNPGTINNNSTKPFVFIIDEINRGEISKIFGELFFSIDPGYRGEKGRINTQYQNLIDQSDSFADGFYIPENVYIIGTMNDIDRSVESMDFAFRRRFTFCEIRANENLGMLDELEASIRNEAKNRLFSLNNAISNIDGLSSAYHIGGAYLLKLKELDNDFEKLWDYHLEGLLREYLRGMEDEKGLLETLKSAYENPNQLLSEDAE